MSPVTLPSRPVSPVPDGQIVVAGVVALAVAMGIGRFAFTPLLPLMLRDGALTVGTGAEWAAANYLGYLVGALTASRFASDPGRGLRISLLGVAASTLAMTWAGDVGTSAGGALLRGAAGVFSAWTLICLSAWGLAELARRKVPHLGAWMYAGVGCGIMLAGLLAWLGGLQPARWLWAELGLLAFVGAFLIRDATLRVRAPAVPPVSAHTTASSGAPATASGAWPLVLCYGTFAFGYIVPATFLPAMARQQVENPLVFGLAWPLFGLAAALSVVAAARWLAGWPRRRVWAMAQALMAVGTALPIATQALWSLALSAIFVGGAFMVATMAGLQLARELQPAQPTRLLARMTIAFAIGQIVGPLLVRALGPQIRAGWDALAVANAVATALLLLSAVFLWRGRGAVETS